MKKKIISFTAIIALLFGSMFMTQSKAQIFIMGDEESSRMRANESELPNIPWLGVDHDQYAPLGSEVLVLGLLGGAYLLVKCREKKK
ncbi:MAG: hypothetical protein ACTTKO_10600 [Candidatus Limimorpha sp.]